MGVPPPPGPQSTFRGRESVPRTSSVGCTGNAKPTPHSVAHSSLSPMKVGVHREGWPALAAHNHGTLWSCGPPQSYAIYGSRRATRTPASLVYRNNRHKQIHTYSFFILPASPNRSNLLLQSVTPCQNQGKMRMVRGTAQHTESKRVC